jgi:thiol-disulfide isomerase/thioredoxin
MAFFKLPKMNKKIFKNGYFCTFCVIVIGYFGYMLYNNIDKFTNTKFLDSSQKQLVLFYSPDCGYCKQVLPIWNKFELDFNGRKNIQITKINGYSYPDLCKNYGIEGFPTIMFIKDGSIVAKYSGDRTYNSFVEFLNQMK